MIKKQELNETYMCGRIYMEIYSEFCLFTKEKRIKQLKPNFGWFDLVR